MEQKQDTQCQFYSIKQRREISFLLVNDVSKSSFGQMQKPSRIRTLHKCPKPLHLRIFLFSLPWFFKLCHLPRLCFNSSKCDGVSVGNYR